MNPHPNEELISAYLDGELPPDQRAQVEKSLAENAELRQLCDELRALGTSLRALPRHQLERDLAPSIVRRAERSVLGDPAGRPGAAAVEPDGSLRAWWSRGAGWRRLAWPAVIAAAALLMFLFDSQRKLAERPVAQSAPKGESYIGAAKEKSLQQQTETLAAQRQEAHEEAPKLESDEQKPLLYYSNDKSATADELGKVADGVPTPPALSRPAAAAQRSARFAQSGPAPAASDEARMVPLAIGEGKAAHATVVCEVSAQFVRSQSFEKLLEGNKVSWKREPLARLGLDSPAPADDRKTPPEHQRDYVMEISPQELEQIISQLRIGAGVSKVTADQPAKALAKSSSKARGPVRFVLRWSETEAGGNRKP